VTRSAAGCRIYVPPVVNDESDCLGRVLNDDGTFTIRMTLGQGLGDAMVSVGEVLSTVAPTDEIADFAQAHETDGNTESSSRQLPVVPVGDVPLNPELLIELPVTFDEPCGPTPEPGTIPVPNQVVALVDEWGRDTCVINEVCAMIEDMARPWSPYRAFEAASAQFPNIDRAALRLAVMAVLMGQRRCVNRMINAGLASGAQRDENGATYLELNNACADDYRNSYY